jgi:DNA-binding GntR family transcriptional regulator
VEKKFKKLNRKTLRHDIYEQLRQSIITGDLLPGESITLRNIAEQFGVSIMPVREALWQLESENIIVIESNRSIRVNSLSVSEMEEALSIRIMLETEASRLACERRPESAIPIVEKLLSTLVRAINKPKKYMDDNSRYHFAIYQYSSSPVLLEIINALWARVGPYFIIHANDLEDLHHTTTFHKRMFEGFVRRDRDMIAEAVRDDLQNAARLIIPKLAALAPSDVRDRTRKIAKGRIE